MPKAASEYVSFHPSANRVMGMAEGQWQAQKIYGGRAATELEE
jgi:hypothetical protein